MEDSLRDIESFRKDSKPSDAVEEIARNPICSPKKPGDVLVSEHYTMSGMLADVGKTQMRQLEHATHYKERKDSFDKIVQKWGAQEVIESPSGTFLSGQLHSFHGESDAAINDHLKAIKLLEAGRTDLPDEKSRSTFFDDKTLFYDTAILELLERRRFAEAFELIERSRFWRGMADLLFTKKLH